LLKNRLRGEHNIVHTHVKPIPETENVSFAKFIYDMESSNYFKYFMLMFREKILNSLGSNSDVIGLLSFLQLLNSEIRIVSEVYEEYLAELEKSDNDV
jgi:hypothetical protein